MREFQTSIVRRDIDQAAKYIGAGAATVGVAGSGRITYTQDLLTYSNISVISNTLFALLHRYNVT